MKKIKSKKIQALKGFPQYIKELKGVHNTFDYGFVLSALYEYKNLKIFLDNSETRNAKYIASQECAKEIIKRRQGEVADKIDILDYSITKEAEIICNYFSRIRKGISTLEETSPQKLYAIISRHDYGKENIFSEYTLEAFADSSDIANEISEYMKTTEKHSGVMIVEVGTNLKPSKQNFEMGN
jgi:hypothetical protein